MRTYLFKIGGMVAGAALLAVVSTGCQKPTTPIASVPQVPAVPAPEPSVPSQPSSQPQPSPVPAVPDATLAVDRTTVVNPVEPVPQYEADQQFILTNALPIAMHYFYASPSNVDDWENDILAESILLPGESSFITIDDNRQSCIYDFLAVLEDGSEMESYDINICELSSYTFN
jgi:hypothetical protein